MAERMVRLGAREYPVVGPRLNDARLHLAAVIVSIHVLGQVALEFRVSVVQVAASIGVCFLIEGARTFLLDRRFVWPASAMLTGSGVALILRLPDAEANQPWATDGWLVYVVVAALSLVTKYLVRFRGTHVFNPSNAVLVVTFVVLGSGRVEPLDFWWAPLGVDMVLAYTVIGVGGLVIASRLGLLELAAAFWVTLAAALGALAVSGHCFHATWALHPVCDAHFWWIVVTSPETMIFLFFMITDPRTVPASREGRVVFGIAVASVSALMIAPQTTEFGAKVGLLAGLAICSAVRPMVVVASEAVAARRTSAEPPTRSRVGRPTVILSGLVLAALVVVAGAPARQLDAVAGADTPELIDPSGRLPPIDPGSLPPVEVDAAVRDFDPTMDVGAARELAATFAWLLAVEGEAVANADTALARAVTQGRRRVQVLDRIAVAEATGLSTTTDHRFDALRLVLVRRGQGAVRLGFETSGLVREVDIDQDGAMVGSREAPTADIYVLFGPSMGRWFVFDTLSHDS